MPRGVYDRTPEMLASIRAKTAARSSNTGQCQVDGCDQPSSGRRANICEMHYYRLRRTGTTVERPAFKVGHYRGCAECGKPFKLRSRPRQHCSRACAVKVGADHHSWLGSGITYSAAHERTRSVRGHPRRCEHCGATDSRMHWALDHERCGEPLVSGLGPYSPDPNDYIALCVSCHKTMDMARIQTKREQATQ